jgi:hypothetical protein
MEKNSSTQKSNSLAGVIQLPANCVPIDVAFDLDILGNVDEADKKHMVLLIEYCCYQISNVNINVRTLVNALVDPLYPTKKTYQLIVSLDRSLVISSKHFDDLKLFDVDRITQRINVIQDSVTNRQIMTIPVNASCSKVVVTDATLLMIHFQQTHTRTVVYGDDNDDDRGSTKRVRYNKDS